MKKIVTLFLVIMMVFGAMGVFAGGGKDSGAAAKGQVYFLNFKPEQDAAYKAIAQEYTKATGIPVKVVTAAAGTYETQLKSEMAKRDAPTVFQINGPVGYASWKAYCLDLKDTELYRQLSDKGLAVSEGGGVYGIPFAVEGYGIIYNKAIFDKYFALAGAKAKSMQEINNFAKLKAVVEDMTAKKAQLGIKGVFASTSLAKGEDWRWQTHLANVPLYYEFRDNKVDLGNPGATAEIKFQYAPNFKNLFDLYLNNSVTDKRLLGSKSVSDSMAEFALGECAMVQNGNWAYGDISKTSGNVVTPANVGFLPLYTGMPGEEKQGICIGTENFLCVNSKASAADQKASLDFFTWLYTSTEGKAHVTKDLGFIAPFSSFGENEKPTDPLGRAVMSWASASGISNVPWNFTVFPSQTFKDNFGQNLLQYAQGSMDWATVVSRTISDWKTEKANAAR